jgi:hypothetical protein
MFAMKNSFLGWLTLSFRHDFGQMSAFMQGTVQTKGGQGEFEDLCLLTVLWSFQLVFTIVHIFQGDALPGWEPSPQEHCHWTKMDKEEIAGDRSSICPPGLLPWYSSSARIFTSAAVSHWTGKASLC